MHSTTITAVAFLLSVATAHMFMATPPPWSTGLGPKDGLLKSSPLGMDTTEDTMQTFPCQFGPDYKYPMDNATKVAAGESTLLSFKGSAVHGGGSCQLSLAKTPSADPKDWHVIHSIIGGCPGTNAPNEGESHSLPGGQDNLVNIGGPDAVQCTGIDTDELTCLKKYNIPIPKEIASGLYYFGWTWFNKVGNREMYMNCAPLEVTNGGTSDDFLNAQPGIFMANYAAVPNQPKPCVTDSQFSLDFPQPGNSVLRSQNVFDNVEVNAQGIGAQCAAIYPPQKSPPSHIAFLKLATGGNDTLPASGTGGPLTTTSIAGSAPEDPAITATSTLTSYVPAVFAPGASPVPASSIPASSGPASSPSAIPVASNTPATPVAGCANPCTEDDKVVCLPSNQFGICDHGCAVAQALAAGTRCSNGAIVGLTGKRGTQKGGLVMKPRRAALMK